jgi:hypothetical protein
MLIMTLRQMLSIIDFDYEITKENQIALIDKQGANLGGIDQERWDITDDVCMQIIDRLDTYFTDSIYDDIIEECKDCLDGKDPFDGDWKLMWFWLLDTEREKLPNTISKFEISIVYYILNPEDIIIEEMLKER